MRATYALVVVSSIFFLGFGIELSMAAALPFLLVFSRGCFPYDRDKGLKDRSKPRRLASLPGHTDDLLRHTRGDEVSRTTPRSAVAKC